MRVWSAIFTPTTMSTDHSPYRGGTCWDETFTAYHDPNVHILLTCIYGIFALVFVYYFCMRRPKAEYFFLLAFCALEVGAFALRIYGEIIDGSIGMIIYSAAMAMSVCVMYMLYARWTQIADRYHGSKIFNLAMFHPAFITLSAIVIIILVIAGIWVPSVMWVLYLVLFFAIWVTTIATLIRHRLLRPAEKERTIVLSQMEGSFYNVTPLVTSHKTLDNMMVMLVVLSTIMFIKSIFLTVAFALVLLYFIAPLYYVFCMLEDLAFVVILSSPEAVQLFEPSRHRPELRQEINTQNLFNPAPQNYPVAQPDAGSNPYSNQVPQAPQQPGNYEAITIPNAQLNPNAPYLNTQGMPPQSMEDGRPVAY